MSMSFNDIPRTHSFSLSDFHDFDRCIFRFFVNHHLEKKYELAEGNENQVIGTILDLAIKKVHATKSYGQPFEYMQNFIKAAEVEIRTDVVSRGEKSFYGSQIDFLTPEVLERAREVFKNYHQGINGKYRSVVATYTLQKPRPFWKKVINGNGQYQIWGGPDSIEMGEDGVPEVVDYKFFGDPEKGQGNLDMDLMPKIYTFLVAEELLRMGYSKTRFKIRLWQDPTNESFYEEFDLNEIKNVEELFKNKIERILGTTELKFCDRDFCKVCSSDKREEWIKEIQKRGWVGNFSENSSGADTSDTSTLPF